MSKYTAVLLAGCAVALLPACGMKGSLELPPGPGPEPLLGRKPARTAPAPSLPIVPPAEDVSTDPNSSLQ